MKTSVNQRVKNIIDDLYSGNKRAFAKEIGVSPTVIENIVGTRQGNPSFEVTQKIYANANINLEWLLTGEGNMRKNSNDKPVPDKYKVDKNTPLLSRNFEENRLSYYLNHSDKEIDRIMSDTIRKFKDLFNALKKLTIFVHDIGAPKSVIERFELLEDFENFKNDVDKEFSTEYTIITDEKVLKCSLIMHYERDIEALERDIIQMIEYIQRYSYLFPSSKTEAK